MSGAIAIFVKTPGYSAVKTRLAATLGADVAEAWHLHAAATVAAVATDAGRALGAEVYWAVAERDALTARCWATLPRLPQGTGGLGARMGRVHTELVARHGHGLLLGADTPQLPVVALRAALHWCAAGLPRQALGPAHDGGFWLYAGNRATALADWETVVYSRADTAAAFRTRFAAAGEWRVLQTLTDVDRRDDLPAMRRELAALAAPTEQQRALAAWLDATLDDGDARGTS